MATITKEPIGQLHEKISVKLEKADYLPAFEKSLKEHSKKATLPGFRPGKVPSGMIKKMYGPSLFVDEVLKSVDKELIEYLQNEKVDIFAQPLPLDSEISKLDANNPGDYNFDFEIGLKTEFELANLSTANITAYNIDITDEMINSEIDRLQNRYGNMIDKDIVDNDEDILNVTFIEIDNAGNEIEGGIKKDNSILLKYFANDTRNEFTGKKTGDTINIVLGKAFEEEELDFIAQDLGLSKDDASTKEKEFKIEITKLGLLKKRELDEVFFEQMYPGGEVKTEEDFKKKIHDEIFQYWASQSRNQIHDQVFHSLVDNTKIDFPEAFLRKWLVTQNSNAENKQPVKTEEQIDKEMPDFLNQLKWNLISDKIVTDNSIQVSPEEIKEFAKQQLFNYMGGNAPMVEEQQWIVDYVDRMMKDRKYVEETYMQLQSQKIFDWAEKEIKPVSQSISADDFTKMLSEHKNHHH